jgi:RNA polymerase sigma factor (sigma-70 family)
MKPLDGLPIRVDPEYLIRRASAGDLMARDVLIEIVVRQGRKTLRKFSEEIRERATFAVVEKLFEPGLLGSLALLIYFDPSRGIALTVWLKRALKNAAVDELRRREPEHLPFLLDDETGAQLVPGAADPTGDPVAQLEAKQLVEAFAADLSPREQQVATLLGQGHSDVEIADLLGVKPASVRATAARVRRKLRGIQAAQ